MDGIPDSSADPVVLLCPGIDVTSVEMALELSLKGETNHNRREVTSEIKQTLTSLGVSGEIVTEELIHQKQEGVKTEAVSDESDMDSSSDYEEDSKSDKDYEYEEGFDNGEMTIGHSWSEEMEEMESTLDESTGQMKILKLKCPLCPRRHVDFAKFKWHLSLSHFQDEVSELASFDRNFAGSMCHLCGKDYPKSSKWEVLFCHISIQHKYLDQVMPEQMKRKLNQYILKARPKAFKRGLFQVEGEEEVGPPCPLCDMVFDQFIKLKRHMINKHYKADILKACKPTDFRRCPYCNQPMGHDKMTKSHLECHMVIHIGSKHGLLEETMNSDLKKKWQLLKEKYDHKKPVHGIDKVEASKGFTCPLCQKNYANYRILWFHLCNCHYRNEILRRGGATNEIILNCKCHLCGQELTKNAKKRCTKANSLAVHLGSKHNFFEMVLPDDVKQQVNEQKLRIEPNMDKARLLPMSHTKKPGQTCLLCDRNCGSVTKFNDHLIQYHYKQDIIRHKFVDDFKRCPVCLKLLSRENHKLTIQQSILAKHLGTTHKFLQEVMAPDVKQRWINAVEEFKKTET